ncbi:unnamed protein product [Prorocentrum cordatum]|uniref:Enoyl reductase (ER) domain-containing protein n=1 Tax=Prorocentrum cordatum TaxID=2364126 RepID=A0ABN9QG94_9DINO|nr:unnamed protein product [Polarella glacialis]
MATDSLQRCNEPSARLQPLVSEFYSQYTKIDSRLISKMPSTLSFEDAAALPLTFQTAWEGMVELMGVQKGKSIFVLNGAGRLGSIVIQVAKHLGLAVIASASRAETIEFCKQMGADHVVNHRNEDLGAELKQVGFDCVDYIYNAHENDRLGELFKLLVCDGRLVVTYGPTQEQMAKVDWTTVWLKRQTLCFQMMFARPMFNTEPAMVGGVMATMAKLVDQGSIKTTVTMMPFLMLKRGQEALSRNEKVMGGDGKLLLRTRR